MRSLYCLLNRQVRQTVHAVVSAFWPFPSAERKEGKRSVQKGSLLGLHRFLPDAQQNAKQLQLFMDVGCYCFNFAFLWCRCRLQALRLPS